jgi:hypothetical protein
VKTAPVSQNSVAEPSADETEKKEGSGEKEPDVSAEPRNTTEHENMNATTTILPDGSAFFTAEIMSKEEAMRLPLKDRPLCYRISSEMYYAVFEAVGEASMCWHPRPSNEVFSSEEASNVAVKLCFKIADEMEKRDDVAKGF